MAPGWSGDWSYCGLRAVVLENRRLRVVVLPELGGKIWSIVYKPCDREVLWHHPRQGPRSAPFGAAFDDWFAGGWDELFPNDAPAVANGDGLPDHGEWWSLPCKWQVGETPGAVSLRLSGAGVVTAHRWERTIELRQDEAVLRLRTTVRNVGWRPLPFIWRTHPALAAAPGARIELPAEEVVVDPLATFGLDERSFRWPLGCGVDARQVDLALVPEPSADGVLLAYANRLREGWCGLVGADGVAVAFAFDPREVETVTVFASFGGWRGLQTVILEPGVGWPHRLDAAIANGSAQTLAAGAETSFGVTMTVADGMSRILAVSVDGVLTGR